jgi:hypothetical protein
MIGISPFSSSILLFGQSGGTPVDPDAQAFITAAAITDPTQQSAVNQLVVDLKGYGVWSKMKALYPFVGGTASQHKFNLKNPLDTNAAFRLVFNGGWTHSATGALPNGTNAWANTFFVSANNFASKDNAHYSFYSRTNLASDGIEIGVNDAPSNQGLYTRSAGGNATFILNGSTTFPNVATANSLGFYQANRNALNTISGWKNGIKLSQISSISVVSTFPSFSIGAYNMNNLTANYYSSKQCAFASIGDGLTDTEAANFYTAVQTFQTTLGRSIGTQTVSDADAQAFVTNANIVDQVEANAINNLVIGMKADGVWSKMKAIYPFVGGSSTSHSYNLVNPSLYQITWNGGVTHNSNGITGSVNSFGNTNLSPSSALSLNSTHICSAVKVASASTGRSIMGLTDSGFANGLYIYPRLSNQIYFDVNASSGANNSLPNTVETGVFIVSRTNSTQQSAYRNGISLGTSIRNSAALSTRPISILAININGTNSNYYISGTLTFSSVGLGLDATESLNLTNRINTFNTTLGR